jgi:hypothetical protein
MAETYDSAQFQTSLETSGFVQHNKEKILNRYNLTLSSLTQNRGNWMLNEGKFKIKAY